jgi:hypothetical protein
MIWEYGIHTGKDNVKVRAENLFLRTYCDPQGKRDLDLQSILMQKKKPNKVK